MNVETAVSLTLRLGAVAVIIQGLETLAVRQALRPGGLLAWDLGRLRSKRLSFGSLATTLNGLLAWPNVVFLLLAHISLAVIILAAPPPSHPTTPVVVLLAGTSVVL